MRIEVYEQFNGGCSSKIYWIDCIQRLFVHFNLEENPERYLQFYFKKNYSPVDIVRMANKNVKIKSAKIVIEWEDEFGPSTKEFHNSKDAREFLSNFTSLRVYLSEKG